MSLRLCDFTLDQIKIGMRFKGLKSGDQVHGTIVGDYKDSRGIVVGKYYRWDGWDPNFEFSGWWDEDREPPKCEVVLDERGEPFIINLNPKSEQQPLTARMGYPNWSVSDIKSFDKPRITGYTDDTGTFYPYDGSRSKPIVEVTVVQKIMVLSNLISIIFFLFIIMYMLLGK